MSVLNHYTPQKLTNILDRSLLSHFLWTTVYIAKLYVMYEAV